MSEPMSFEHLVNGLSVGLCVVNDQRQVVYANAALAVLAGREVAELVGKPLSEVIRFAGGALPTEGTHTVCVRVAEGPAQVVSAIAQPCGEGTSLLVLPSSAVEAVRWGTTQDRLERVEQLLDRVERIHGNVPSGSTDRDLSASPLLAQLSRREREIVTALVGARPVKQIAANLNISPHTVRNHLKSSFRKLNVGSQVELVAKLTQGPSMVDEGLNGA